MLRVLASLLIDNLHSNRANYHWFCTNLAIHDTSPNPNIPFCVLSSYQLVGAFRFAHRRLPRFSLNLQRHYFAETWNWWRFEQRPCGSRRGQPHHYSWFLRAGCGILSLQMSCDAKAGCSSHRRAGRKTCLSLCTPWIGAQRCREFTH